MALAAALVWRWVSGWGLVTLDFHEAPIERVVAAIQKQSGLLLLTNVPAGTPVTLQVRRAPLFEALDLLAARLDASLSLACALAPNASTARAGLETAAAERRPAGWQVFGIPWGSGFGRMSGGWVPGDTALDLRRVTLSLSQEAPAPSLHPLLEQAAGKTGIVFLAPESWNPEIRSLPRGGRAPAVAEALARAAGGRMAMAVLLTARPQGDRWAQGGRQEGLGSSQQSPPRPQTPPEDGAPRSPLPKPEWLEERMKAQIALLPKEEQAQAWEDYQAFRAAWEEIRALPEDQRRATMQEMMARPDFQQRIEERIAARDMKRTPEQRAARYRNYIERKREALASQP